MHSSTKNLEIKLRDDGKFSESFIERILSEHRDILKFLGPLNQKLGRKILLVGGAGYIGIPITQLFLKWGFNVRCLDSQIYSHDRCIHPLVGLDGYEYIYGDLRDLGIVEKALKGVSDVIILAGLVGDPITKKYPVASKEINDVGLKNFIEALSEHHLNKVIFISTCSNYGEISGNEMASESFKLNPLSLYAQSKVKIEKLITGLKGKVKYSGTILRFATAFGLSGRMRFDLTVSEFTRAAFFGEHLSIYDADTWRPYCHVRDFGNVLLRVLLAPKKSVFFETFNAGGNINNYTKKMMVDKILEHLPDANVSYVSGGVDRRNYRVNFDKIKNALDFEPSLTVEDGIIELIHALQQNLFGDYTPNSSIYRNNKISGPKKI